MKDQNAFSHLLNKDYGARCSSEKTTFRIFAIDVQEIKIAIYEDSFLQYRNEYIMEQEGPDLWSLTLHGDFHGLYYTYILKRGGKMLEVVDPYALSASVNSIRGGIVDLERTNPEGFLCFHEMPSHKLENTIIYELHIRDFTSDGKSGIINKGKYIGLIEEGSQCNGLSTGIDHLTELGITHVHLLPIADFGSVDDLDPSQYNWGYDPILFNAPEGSYAIHPEKCPSRIQELKAMIHGFHKRGIRVIIDVVYNHTYDAFASSFVRLAPGIFYREKEGVLTNGSGVGCELNTEHPLVADFINQSLLYWMKEYQVDGFRFDLMALYDVEFVQNMSKCLRQYKPDILLYGEPWVGGDSGLASDKQFLKGKQKGLHVGLFNDQFRNSIKGDNDGTRLGLVQGNEQELENARLGITGSIEYSALLKGFAANAKETINYVSSHDNLILRDKIERTISLFDKDYLLNTNRLAITLILTAFGIPFIQAGIELYRSKNHHHNTYNMGDEINQILWSNKEKYYAYFAYISALIEFRKASGVFHISTPKDIREKLVFVESDCLSYTIEKDDYIYSFYHNYKNKPVLIAIPHPVEIFFFNALVDLGGIVKKNALNEFLVEGKSSLILRYTKKKSFKRH